MLSLLHCPAVAIILLCSLVLLGAEMAVNIEHEKISFLESRDSVTSQPCLLTNIEERQKWEAMFDKKYIQPIIAERVRLSM